MSRRKKETALRIPLVPLLLIAFIAVPLAEIAVFIEVGERIGVGWTLLLIVLTALLGVSMLRRQGFAVLRRAQQQLDQGVAPVAEVFEGLCLLAAGVLLLTPGFITDVTGALLLVPAVRSFLYQRVRSHLERQIVRRAAGQRGPAARTRPPTIEAEFEVLEPDESDERPVPPPRGGWDRRP